MRKQIFTSIVLALFVIIGSHTAAQQAKPFTLKLGAVRGSIQWEQSSDRTTWTNIGGGTTDSVQVQATKTTYYRAKITEVGCAPVYSDIKAAWINGEIVVPAQIIKGKVQLPDQSIVKTENLKVYSNLDSVKVNTTGNFELLVADSSTEFLLCVTNQFKQVCLLAHFIGPQTEYNITARSTSLALLLSYPFLKPVSTERKSLLVQQYQAEPEFGAFDNAVTTLIKNGRQLFDTLNTSLRNGLLALVKKSFNGDRYRTTALEDIEVGNNGTELILTNNKEFSYVGSIYRESDGINVKPFFVLAGKLLNSSTWVQYRPEGYKLTAEDRKSTRQFDLKALGLESGQYKIVLRTGLAADVTDEDNLALSENTYELIAALLDNLSINITKKSGKGEVIKLECASSIVEYVKTVIAKVMAKNPNANLLNDAIIPALSDGQGVQVDCLNGSEFIELILKYVDLFLNLDEKTAALAFYPEWLTSPKKATLCQTLNPQKTRAYPCGLVELLNVPKEKYLAGDTAFLTVRTTFDPKYYPYEVEKVLPLSEITLTTSTGEASLVNKGRLSLDTVSGIDGKVLIKWIMPCTEVKNTIVINPVGNSKPDNQLPVAALSVLPYIKVVASNQTQVGQPSMPLPQKITLSFEDMLTGHEQIVQSKNFNITWKPVNGSGSISATASTSNDSSFIWTLGPEEGEQVIEATITSKKCNWPIFNNTILFKANKPLQKSVSIVSGNYQEGAPNIYLGDFLIVKVLDHRSNPISGVTVEWSIISGGGSLETLTAVTDNDGLAKTKWKLGSTGIQQARAIVKKPDGTNVDGSPAIFNANLLLQKTVSLVSGDNQGSGPDSYLADFLVVKVLDENNNPVNGTTVQWSVVSGGGSVENSSTVTDNNGLAKTKWKLGLSGDQQVKATVKKADGSDITGSPVVFNAGFAIITTIAGNGTIGYSGDGGNALDASIYPSNICVDQNGNVFFATINRIRKINKQTGIITTVAGDGNAPRGEPWQTTSICPVHDGLPATSDSISTAELCVDKNGNLYFGSSKRIRRVDATTGVISTIIGPGIPDSLGNYPIVGRADSVFVGQVRSLVFDEQGNLFFIAHDRVFKLSAATNRVSVYAGNGSQGNTGDGGPATAASFYKFGILSTDKLGNLYIVDDFYSVVRKVTASTGIVSKVAGIGIGNYSGDGGPAVNAALATPTSVAIDSDGNILISDYGNYRIRRVNVMTGIISTVIGTGQNSFSGDGGNPAQATLGGPRGVYIDKDGYIYISDWGNARIRKAKLFK